MRKPANRRAPLCVRRRLMKSGWKFRLSCAGITERGFDVMKRGRGFPAPFLLRAAHVAALAADFVVPDLDLAAFGGVVEALAGGFPAGAWG